VSGALIIDYDSVKSGDTLLFRLPEKILKHSASEWNDFDLDVLKVEFEDVSFEDFNKLITLKSPLNSTAPTSDHKPNPSKTSSNDLLQSLQFVDQNFQESFANIKHDETSNTSNDHGVVQFQHPLAKALFMVLKYNHLESTVDGFVFLLLFYLGYFEEWLYVFPQYEMVLKYGEDVKNKSKPDFTILDVLSFFRIAVIEDKRELNSDRINSEPQLIAELIALAQKNFETAKNKRKFGESDSDRDDYLIGIRVNGLKFFFYYFEMTNDLFDAMTTLSAPINQTRVKRFGALDLPTDGAQPSGLNFLVPTQRMKLIELLISIRNCIMQKGRASKRRNSGVKHAATSSEPEK
jgi:hypothetical protein